MAQNGYNPSDLTSVLRTLSSLSSAIPPASHSGGVYNDHGSNGNDSGNGNGNGNGIEDGIDDDDHYEPSDAILPPPLPVPSESESLSASPQTQPQPQPQQPTSPQTQPQPPTTPTPAPAPTDPSTITTWPAALRYIMQTVSQSDALQLRLRKLLQSQHDHERQWWVGREALVRKLGERSDRKRELDRVLNAVGVPVDPTKEVSTEENQSELRTYDDKVYRASVQMADAMTLELRGLGIPFFALRRGVVRDGSENGDGDKVGVGVGVGKQILNKDDLRILQRRVLELLQDLCRE